MRTIRKIVISPLHFPVDEIYNFHVSVITSADGGKTYYYCGEGAYARDHFDAEVKAERLSKRFSYAKIESEPA